jgi:hypothetical protein
MDFTSVESFRTSLTPLIQQLTETLTRLSSAKQPPLGEFHDAHETVAHHRALRTNYVERLQQLVWDLIAARDGNEALLGDFVAAHEMGVSAATGLADRPELGGE